MNSYLDKDFLGDYYVVDEIGGKRVAKVFEHDAHFEDGSIDWRTGRLRGRLQTCGGQLWSRGRRRLLLLWSG